MKKVATIFLTLIVGLVLFEADGFGARRKPPKPKPPVETPKPAPPPEAAPAPAQTQEDTSKLTPSQIVKRALETVFAEEIGSYPTLREFLRNEQKPPFQYAMETFQSLSKKDLASLTASIQSDKTYYGKHKGIGDHMFENSNAPDDEDTRREFIARAFPETVYTPPPSSGSGSGGSGGGSSQPSTPTITDFNPKAGYTSDTVTIEGTHLGYTTGVQFQGSTADEFQSGGGGTYVTVFVPPGARSGPITLQTNSGDLVTSEPFKIWSGQCSLTDLNKAFNQLRIRINGEGNQGDCDINKYNNGRYSNYKELRGHVKNVVGFTKMSPPRIQSLEPAFGPPGTKVIVNGLSMDVYADEIRFGGASVFFQLVDDTRATFDVPSTNPGDKEVTLVSDLHGEAKGNFKVAMAPEIGNVDPNPVKPKQTLTVTGNYFDEIQRVDVVHQASDALARITTFSKLTSNELTFPAPERVGSYSIAVFGRYGRSQAASFSVIPPPITQNALGNPEFCFGAVGKGCGGFGDLAEGETKATRPGPFTAGCSEEVNGMRRCWVVPGSIKHDNCCVEHPQGKHCGGPMADGSKAGEFNHNGRCVQEWDDAFWDVKNGRGWEHDFAAKETGNLTPAASPSGRYSGGERVGSVNLCAPDGYSISARHSVAFCCSGNAQKKWAIGVEDWFECQSGSTTRRSVQTFKEKKEGVPMAFDMTKFPSRPGQSYTIPTVASTPALVPVITSVEKTAVEPEEIVTIYGKNFITEENKKKEINFKELALVQGKTQKIVIANAGKNRGDEQSVFFWVPKDAEGSYSLKIWAKTDEKITWDKPPLTVAKKLPPLPVITAVDKLNVEPEEIVTIYGKNLVTRENGKFKEYNFRQLSLVQGKIDKAMVFNVGKDRGEEESVFFMVPKDVTGTYAIKLYVKPEVNVRWENPPLTIARKAPPLPVITTVEKTNVEPEEMVTIYGKNLTVLNEKGQRHPNLKQLLWMKEKTWQAVPVNVGKNRGEEESLYFIAPKDPGSYSIKIETHGGDVIWDKPLIAVAKKAPPLPVLTGISKVEVEPNETMVVYGKNLIAQDASGFTSMNFDKMFFVKDKAEAQVMAIVRGEGRKDEIGLNINAPKEPGSYFVKVIAKSGEVVLFDKPALSVVSLAPLISHAPAKAETQEAISIEGKNLNRLRGKVEESNLKDIFWVKGNVETKAEGVGAARNDGEQDKINIQSPKEPGNYSLKVITAKGTAVWNNPLIAVAKKPEPIPVISSVSKTKAEVGESLTLYGKNLIAQDASGFTSMNFDKMFFVKDGAESRVTAIVGGPKKGDDQSINFSAPKETGSYSIKIVAKSGEIVMWNNPLVAIVDTAAEKKKAEEELAKKKALEEELAKKKSQEELALKKKAEEELALKKKKEQEELAKKKVLEEELARKQEEERQKTIQEAMRQRQAEEEAEKQRKIEQEWGPSPTPSEPEVEEPAAPPEPEPEPEMVRQGPEPQEEARPQCERGTWSPTLQRCIEDEAPQEEERPDCPAGTHWSPTLRSCQPD